MKSVLFVCHGNICRSPLAEFILKNEAARRGKSGAVLIDSAGISDEEHGADVYPPVRELMRRHGIPFSSRRAKLIEKADYSRFDHILCMEKRQVDRLTTFFGGDPEGRISQLGAYAGLNGIADPWYSRDFEKAYEDIAKSVRALADVLFEKQNGENIEKT